MNLSKLFIVLVITIVMVSVPTVAHANGGYSGEATNCEDFGGTTYCLRVQYNVDCTGWNITWFGWNPLPPNGGGQIPPFLPSSGLWTQPGVYETYNYSITVRLWFPTGNLVITATETFQEPLSCDFVPPPPAACPSNNQYYMYTFHDQNQPDNWQKYCYIMSGNGYPSVESQALFCGVPGSDYTYRATQLMYQGWVTKDCNGAVSYGWPAWDSAWFRSNFVK